ncbi:MAG: SRPBCC family protein [Planctomycetota bacterium]
MLIRSLGFFLACAWLFAQTSLAESVEVVLSKRKEGAKTWICAKAQISIEIEWFWRALEDYSHFPKFMPNMQHCRIEKQEKISADEEHYEVYNELVVSFKKIYYTLQLTHQLSSHTIRWSLLSGNIKSTEGFWQLTEEGHTTQVTYEVYTDPGMWVPDFIYEQMTSETIRGVIVGASQWATLLKKIGGGFHSYATSQMTTLPIFLLEDVFLILWLFLHLNKIRKLSPILARFQGLLLNKYRATVCN